MKRATFKTNSYPKDPDFVQNWARQISLRLFLGFFDKIGISPNKITVINFFTNNLAAVYFFSRGNYISNLLGLFFCLSSAAVDYIDGAIARKRGIKSKLGGWLDPMLDFIWQNMLICGIAFGVISTKGGSFWLPVGLLAVVAMVISNRMAHEYIRVFALDAYRGGSPDFIRAIETSNLTLIEKICIDIVIPTRLIFILFFTLRYFIVIGAIFNIMPLALFLIMIFFTIKAIVSIIIYALFLRYQDKKTSPLKLMEILETYYNKLRR